MRYTLPLVLLSTLAYADGINVYSGPTNSLSVIAAATAAKDGVSIMAHAPQATQITLRGDGSLIKTCTGDFCLFVWSRAAMVQRRCVQCELIVTATDPTGKTYRVKTEVIRP